ncbi:MAG TPA: type VI secretion system baseplate subunit TssE [Luteitalea sp.]|nr:type VI secretion system baseplate subunit TssE [Luteitalea sp.]
MPEPVPQDRLQPSLLDRLTDDHPDNRREPVEQRSLSKARLRQAVLRDLAWLFNTVRLDAGVDLTGLSHVKRSVLNYGMAALSGKTASTLDALALTNIIRQAIIDFEPRIVPATLQVRTVIDEGTLDHHNVIGVEIQGHLWAQPVPLELLVRTEIDIETGRVEIADLLPTRA